MFNNDEKLKTEQALRLLKVYRGVVLALSLCVFAFIIWFFGIFPRNADPAPELSIPELNGMEFGVDAAQGWQATGLRLEEGQRFIISYREGDWSIFPEDSFRYGPDGGASACEGSDCVEPLAGYTKSGLIGRIGDSQPFVVGSYLETTAQDSGMLQLRVNDAGTHDNEGFITVLLTWEN
jgi:hypothetical protein